MFIVFNKHVLRILIIKCIQYYEIYYSYIKCNI